MIPASSQDWSVDRDDASKDPWSVLCGAMWWEAGFWVSQVLPDMAPLPALPEASLPVEARPGGPLAFMAAQRGFHWVIHSVSLVGMQIPMLGRELVAFPLISPGAQHMPSTPMVKGILHVRSFPLGACAHSPVLVCVRVLVCVCACAPRVEARTWACGDSCFSVRPPLLTLVKA